MGHVTLLAITETAIMVRNFNPSHHEAVNFIFGLPIFKSVVVTLQGWEGVSYTSLLSPGVCSF